MLSNKVRIMDTEEWLANRHQAVQTKTAHMKTQPAKRKIADQVVGLVIVHAKVNGVNACDGAAPDESMYRTQVPKEFCRSCRPR